MRTQVSLLEPAAPDFDDPLGLLAACHQRMLGFCDLLERLPPWIAANGIDKETTDSARKMLRYFNGAGQLHHQDEEVDLFPMLSKAGQLRELTDRLQQEHQQLDQCWAILAGELEKLLAGVHNPSGLAAAITPFCATYRRHIRAEEKFILSKARTLLNDQQLRRLGSAMFARRQSADDTKAP